MTTIPFLPPSSRRQPLEPPAGPLGDPPPGRRRARERDDRHVRDVDDRVADLGARPGHEVDDCPAGKPASAISSTRSAAQCGVSLAGLKTTRVAGHERRHHLPARDRDREVPGRDDPGDPDRLADAHRPLVRQLARDRVAEHPAALAGHQEGDVDALLDVAAGLGDDLAHLAAHRLRQPLLVLGHQRAEAIQDLAALRGRRPAATSARRVSAALIAIATSAACPAWKRPTTSRVSAGLRLSNVSPVTRVAPLAGDEVAERRRRRRRIGGRRMLRGCHRLECDGASGRPRRRSAMPTTRRRRSTAPSPTEAEIDDVLGQRLTTCARDC